MFFNSQQQHIQSKMCSNCTCEKRQTHVDGSDRTSVHSHSSHGCPAEQKEKGDVVLGLSLGALRTTPNGKRKPLLHKCCGKRKLMSHERCGKFGCNGTPELECFVRSLLSRMQPKQTCSRLLQGHHPISKLLMASDKALALIILDNELCARDQQIEMKKGSRCRKSGSRMGKRCTIKGNTKSS